MAAAQELEMQSFHWHNTELDDHNFEIRGRILYFFVVLSAVVLLVALFLLYSRWLCRLIQPSLANAPDAPPSLSQGLDPTTINALPIIMHRLKSTPDVNTVGDEENECCICLGEFEDGDKLKILPKCRHFYHGECVDRWLSTQSSCPLCRNSLRVDSVVPSPISQ
ncbi:RING-H2 finger protein ATL66-like [Mangifera indica]|uniref:RING-H2 finger protein ATL66-like n=1 Tax=Mangifera indica TaxID=29780 RepID=UPI001CF95941|nr:RING-H2 finger protein ATL66-like [Mangifera indica]